MEQVVEELEGRAAIWHSVQNMYAHRRQYLHNLQLSEELLPLSSLNLILASAATYDSVPLPDLNWYYTHVWRVFCVYSRNVRNILCKALIYCVKC
jgi:hypothetical protein